MIQRTALLTRGITSGNMVNGVLYIDGNVLYSTITNTGFKTLVVRGVLTIDTDISNSGSTDGKGIIVLANSAGAGGDIIIDNNVGFIHALIFAEGTLR